MLPTNTAQICVFFNTFVLGQKGTTPPPPNLTRQFSVLPKLLIFIWCGLLSHCTENCLKRRDKKETGLIVRPGLKIQSMPFSRLVHRRKQSSMSSKLPHHFLFGWLPPMGSLVWAAPEFRWGFIPALKESLQFTWNQQTSSFSFTVRKVKWQHYGNVSILWKMIINSVIKIIGSCLNGFACNCFCSQGLVMCICFVGLFVSSVSELRVGHFLCESSMSDHLNEVQRSTSAWDSDVVNQSGVTNHLTMIRRVVEGPQGCTIIDPLMRR